MPTACEWLRCKVDKRQWPLVDVVAAFTGVSLRPSGRSTQEFVSDANTENAAQVFTYKRLYADLADEIDQAEPVEGIGTFSEIPASPENRRRVAIWGLRESRDLGTSDGLSAI